MWGWHQVVFPAVELCSVWMDVRTHQRDSFKNSPSELFVLSNDISSLNAATAKLELKVS